MKKYLLGLFALCFVLVACPLTPIEQSARNTAAALQGAIAAAQAQYQTQCTSTPTVQACVIINQSIAGQNALITATEGYCGWSVSAPPANPTAPCVPVKTAQAGLQAAINNANLFVTELKGVIK
jgi:hypothetical protein